MLRFPTVANASSQGNNHRRKGRPPPRAGGSGPTLEQLLNEPCPRHGSREKPATHLWKDCAIMKAFKNSNAYNVNHGPGGGSGAGGFHGPGGGSNSNSQNVQGALISSPARVISSSRRGDTRPIQSSSMVDSIMCLPLVCEARSEASQKGCECC